MKKTIKKMPKVILTLVIVVALAVEFFKPVIVSASETINMTIKVHDSSDVTLTAKNGNTNVGNNVAGNGLSGTRGSTESFISFDDTYTNSPIDSSNVTVTCQSTKQCSVSVTVPDDHGVKVVVGGDSKFVFMLNGNNYNSSPIASGSTVDIFNKDNETTPFDGKAYLIWSCSDGGTCFKYFDNISTTDPMFIKASTIKDEITNETFDVQATSKGFALKDAFIAWQEQYKTVNQVSTINWRNVKADDVLKPIDKGRYEDEAIANHGCSREVPEDTFHACVDDYVDNVLKLLSGVGLQPVGEPYSNNAYVSYGDRNFKVTIYNDDYRGISLGSLDGLQYYPSVWNDGYLRVESYDVSGTKKDSPVDIDTVLLEPVIKIKALNEYNSFQILSMEALDVPEDAVSITKVDGEYKIRFSSNFYDKVVFKITGNDNKTYYLRINRITLNTNDTITYKPNDGRDIDLTAEFYFANTTNYSDYIITAKIEYKDGTSKKVEMTNTKAIDDGLGNVTYAYEIDLEHPAHGPAGKGLKEAVYKYTIPNKDIEKINKVYLNVEYKGSTSTRYAGAFAGSGKGVEIHFERGE